MDTFPTWHPFTDATNADPFHFAHMLINADLSPAEPAASTLYNLYTALHSSVPLFDGEVRGLNTMDKLPGEDAVVNGSDGEVEVALLALSPSFCTRNRRRWLPLLPSSPLPRSPAASSRAGFQRRTLTTSDVAAVENGLTTIPY